MIGRRGLLVGVAVSTAYLVVLSVTVVVRHDHVRPLYDGFAPPPSYRFVDPPSFFSSGNVRPTPTSATIRLGSAGSDAAGIATPDGQFVIDLARGAIPAEPGASAITVRITPLAPRRLHRVPGGLRPNGNAYRLEMTYRPRGGRVTRFVKPGSLLIEVPEIGQRLFVSDDGSAWSAIPSRALPPRGLTITAPFAVPGYYLAATNLPELAGQPGRSTRAPVLLGVATAILAAAMFLATKRIGRRRRRADDRPMQSRASQARPG